MRKIQKEQNNKQLNYVFISLFILSNEDIQRIIHGRAEMRYLSSSVQFVPQTPMYYFIYFINTNEQSKMRISQMTSFCLILLSKKLVFFAENEHPTNKLFEGKRILFIRLNLPSTRKRSVCGVVSTENGDFRKRCWTQFSYMKTTTKTYDFDWADII